MMDSCQVPGEVCQLARWPGGGTAAWCNVGAPVVTVAHQESRWRTRCHGDASGDTATRLQHVGDRWHGWMVWQMARWNGGSMAWSPSDVTAGNDDGMVAR